MMTPNWSSSVAERTLLDPKSFVLKGNVFLELSNLICMLSNGSVWAIHLAAMLFPSCGIPLSVFEF